MPPLRIQGQFGLHVVSRHAGVTVRVSAGAILGSFIALLFVGYKAKGMLVLYASLAYAVILFGFGTASTLWMGMLMIGLLGAAMLTVIGCIEDV